ncbi:hypothetical protein PanWU01x14_349420 [Parasponia andersonii]|uniref:Uncharacterized protein n=1 Tax=Parasponia andersonii TaxID=3476 RepID=A0A2P5ABA6_PARAD|nr:hypothetical protein PanWU01x14_349420 [Parasponia andersonii]
MAPSSNSGSSGISSRGSSSSQPYPLSSSLDIILSSPTSPPPKQVSPQVDQASVDNLQAQINALSEQLIEIQLYSRAELHYYVQRSKSLKCMLLMLLSMFRRSSPM